MLRCLEPEALLHSRSFPEGVTSAVSVSLVSPLLTEVYIQEFLSVSTIQVSLFAYSVPRAFTAVCCSFLHIPLLAPILLSACPVTTGSPPFTITSHFSQAGQSSVSAYTDRLSA